MCVRAHVHYFESYCFSCPNREEVKLASGIPCPVICLLSLLCPTFCAGLARSLRAPLGAPRGAAQQDVLLLPRMFRCTVCLNVELFKDYLTLKTI